MAQSSTSLNLERSRALLSNFIPSLPLDKVTFTKKSTQDEKFAKSIWEVSKKGGQSYYFNWIIIALFYSAIHLLDAKFSDMLSKGNMPNHHKERTKLVQLYFNKIFDDYEQLRSDCENARYYDPSFKEHDVEDSLERFERIKRFLK